MCLSTVYVWKFTSFLSRAGTFLNQGWNIPHSGLEYSSSRVETVLIRVGTFLIQGCNTPYLGLQYSLSGVAGLEHSLSRVGTFLFWDWIISYPGLQHSLSRVATFLIQGCKMPHPGLQHSLSRVATFLIQGWSTLVLFMDKSALVLVRSWIYGLLICTQDF